MTDFRNCWTILCLTAVVVLYAPCAQVSGQRTSSRGVNPIGPRSMMQRRAVPARPMPPLINNNNPSMIGGNVNMGAAGAAGAGPLGFDYVPVPIYSGPTFYFDAATPDLSTGEMSIQDSMGTPGSLPLAGSRPTIRPRLNVSDPEAMNSAGVLQNIRRSVLEQIAQSAERPFSAEWYAAHESVVPIPIEGGNPWSSRSWDEAKAWIGLNGEPQRYDYRPDARGLIFVYRNEMREGRAVDARRSAVQLAGSASSAGPDDAPGLSLGVFAAVPPVEQPATTLWNLILDKTGVVSGYQYDLAADSVSPVRGAVDPASQRTAWQAGNAVVETGLGNLTDDLARALVFRADGWTQPWILMRIPESLLIPAQNNKE
ncbi:MAG: hypothetical protein ACYC6N_08535 [Pirellulaceae bacterium]